MRTPRGPDRCELWTLGRVQEHLAVSESLEWRMVLLRNWRKGWWGWNGEATMRIPRCRSNRCELWTLRRIQKHLAVSGSLGWGEILVQFRRSLGSVGPLSTSLNVGVR